MKNRLSLYTIAATGNALLLLSCGLLVFFSISYQPSAYLLNLIVGTLFLLAAGFVYSKMRNTQGFLRYAGPSRQRDGFMKMTLLQALFFTIVYVAMLSAVISRVLGEQVAVFD